MGIFVDATTAKLRSGWMVALFAGVATGTYAVLSFCVALLGLYPQAPLSLDDAHLLANTGVMLCAATVPTLVCVFALKADAGLPRPPALRHLALGAAMGAGLVALAVVVPAAAGQGAITFSPGAFRPLLLAALGQFLILAPTSIGEELLLRGVVLRQLASGTRPWLAVLLTGGLFGVMHLVNPNASAIAALNVALVGLWFGVLALRTSLWTAIGAHVAWNWFEGFFFGQPVSGINPGHSLFGGTVTPPGFFSGGDFGPEASGLTAVLLVAATLVALAWPKSLDTAPQFPWKPPT